MGQETRGGKKQIQQQQSNKNRTYREGRVEQSISLKKDTSLSDDILNKMHVLHKVLIQTVPALECGMHKMVVCKFVDAGLRGIAKELSLLAGKNMQNIQIHTQL